MRNPIRNGILALAASSILAYGVGAQDSKPPGSAQPTPQVRPDMEGKLRAQEVRRLDTALFTLISVDFPGGTVGEYIETVKEAAKKAQIEVNVICPAEAREVQVSPIALRSVTLRTAMDSLCAAFAGNTQVMFDSTSVGKEPNEYPTFALRMSTSNRAPQYAPDASGKLRPVTGNVPFINVLGVRDLIEPPVGTAATASTRVTKETLLEAVNAAFSLQKDEAPPEILFHADTGLLIVRGTNQQNALASMVLERIRDDLKQRREQSALRSGSGAERARRLASVMARLDVAKAEYSEARETLQRLSKLREQGTVPEAELSKARLDVVRSEGKLKEIMADAEQVEAEANQKAGEPGATGPSPVLVRDVYDVSDIHVAPSDLGIVFKALAGEHGTVSDAESKKITVTAEEPNQKNIRLMLYLMRLGIMEGPKHPPIDKAKLVTP